MGYRKFKSHGHSPAKAFTSTVSTAGEASTRLHYHSRVTRRRFSRDWRGAALVEMAIITPMLMLILMGTIELSFALSDYLTVENMTRTGARVISAGNGASLTDYDAIQQVKKASASIGQNNIEYIVIFRVLPDGSNGDSVPSQCRTQSIQGLCNNVDQSELNDPQADWACNPAFLVDRMWCPTDRDYYLGTGSNVNDIATGTDRFGIYIQVSHHSFTGIFDAINKLSDTTVMNLEPKN